MYTLSHARPMKRVFIILTVTIKKERKCPFHVAGAILTLQDKSRATPLRGFQPCHKVQAKSFLLELCVNFDSQIKHLKSCSS